MNNGYFQGRMDQKSQDDNDGCFDDPFSIIVFIIIIIIVGFIAYFIERF